MNALTAGIASFILFGGQNLDGWMPLGGDWRVVDDAMVCAKGPASIRSVFESDAFKLTFHYRATGGLNRVFVQSRLSTGGAGLTLASTGLSASSQPADPAGDSGWLQARLTVGGGKLRAVCTRADGKELEPVEIPCDPKGRGFIRFESHAGGLQIKDVRVSEPGFESLFDGKTLEGWDIVRPRDFVTAGWVVEEGVIKCNPQKSSWLRTLRTYDNFVLRLEYRLPPRGNSGIYVRAPLEGRVSRIGMEFQLLDDAGFKGKVKPAQFTGSIYDGIAPEVSVPCPVDQWNAIEILVDGKHARAILNGIQLYDALLTDASKDTNAKARPLATRRLTGFIGLQDHSAPVRFRNIRIRQLPATATQPGGK